MNEEEKLKKARDQYESENQQIYDEVTKGNEELRRRQEQKSNEDIIEEVMGPDEDDDEGISTYALNRQKLNESRIFEENRFQNQVQTTKKVVGDFATGVVEDLSTPRGATEFTLDMLTEAGILARSFQEDLPTGIAAVAARR